jgi:hypothetical protein
MQISPSPISTETKPADQSKMIGILVAIVVILVIVAIILVLAQKKTLSNPSNPGGSITEVERAKILESLQQEAAQATPISEADRAKILESLQN